MPCPHCGAPYLHFTGHEFRCKSCMVAGPQFCFKFLEGAGLNPELDVMRRDKLVIYLPNTLAANALVPVLRSLQSYYAPEQPLFTHEICRGVGIANEPTEKDVSNYNELLKKEKEVISFGQHITSIIAKHFVGGVRRYLPPHGVFDKEKHQKELESVFYYVAHQSQADPNLQYYFTELEKYRELFKEEY